MDATTEAEDAVRRPPLVRSPESATRGSNGLAVEAEIAMLRLQLRAAEQEATAAELAVYAHDPDRSLAEVDLQLDPMVDRRCRELEAELAEARATAVRRVEDARRQVGELLSADFLPVVPVGAGAVTVVPRSTEDTFDPAAFAHVFATTLAQVLDERSIGVPAAARRSGYWAHARHVDVLLIAAATAILGVIVAAWLV